MKKGERHKQQAAAATRRALKSQGFPSEPVTSHSRRTSRFSSVQLEGTKKKKKRKKKQCAGPDNERASRRRPGCCWTRTAAYKLTCLGHFGQQLHQPPVLLVLLAFGLGPATN